jgi:hypothetical protein
MFERSSYGQQFIGFFYLIAIHVNLYHIKETIVIDQSTTLWMRLLEIKRLLQKH